MIKRYCDICGDEIVKDKQVAYKLTLPNYKDDGTNEWPSSEMADDVCKECMVEMTATVANSVKNVMKQRRKNDKAKAD